MKQVSGDGCQVPEAKDKKTQEDKKNLTPDTCNLPPEIGGAPGPEPTRYGDWQHKGRTSDF